VVVVVVVVEVEVDGFGFEVVDIVVVVVVVVEVVVVVVVDVAGCAPSQQVSSDVQVFGGTQDFAEIQNNSPSEQNRGNPLSAVHSQYLSLQQAFDRYMPFA